MPKAGGGSSGSSVLIVEETIEKMTDTVEQHTLNKTWKEIYDAFISGTTVLLHDALSCYRSVSEVGAYTEDTITVYNVSTYQQYGASFFATEEEGGYPTYVG